MYDDELTNDELYALDKALASLSSDEISMDVSTMEGFFTALALGPTTQMPSTWLPWIWDMHEGKVAPDFKSMDEASRVLGLVMRHYNAVVRQFMTDPAGFEPLYYFDVVWGAAEWSEGFLLGMQFDSQPWARLMQSQPAWFTPFLRMGTDEGMELLIKEPDGGRWMEEVVPALLKIHAHWQPQRYAQPEGWVDDEFEMGGQAHGPVVRTTPKVGRNDPCPCGSGRKFKKCCGSAEPTLH